MKIFIFTYDRYDSITTSEYFKNNDHIILCHDEESKQKYLEHNRIYGDIIATKEPKGLANNRNYALNMMEKGEWALFFVDDLIQINEYNYYDEADYEDIPDTIDPNKSFNKKIDSKNFIKRCETEIQKCEKDGAFLSGFASNENGYFLKRKYKYKNHVDGRAWLVKKDVLSFDTNTQLIDDYSFTALNLFYYGKVNVNQWIIPKCKRYTEGGYGSVRKRLKQKMEECAYLVNKYPNIVHYANKKNQEEYSHVVIRYKKLSNQMSMF